jgi:hypothetical protein
MAHELDELIPEWISVDILCYHRILSTQIPGNHDALKACPPVDAARRKEGKQSLIRFRKEKKGTRLPPKRSRI